MGHAALVTYRDQCVPFSVSVWNDLRFRYFFHDRFQKVSNCVWGASLGTFPPITGDRVYTRTGFGLVYTSGMIFHQPYRIGSRIVLDRIVSYRIGRRSDAQAGAAAVLIASQTGNIRAA